MRGVAGEEDAVLGALRMVQPPRGDLSDFVARVGVRQKLAEEVVGFLLRFRGVGSVGECGLLSEVGDRHVADALGPGYFFAVLQVTGNQAGLGGAGGRERSGYVGSRERRR